MSNNSCKEKSKSGNVIPLAQTTKDKLHTLLYVTCECSLTRSKITDYVSNHWLSIPIDVTQLYFYLNILSLS